MISGRSKRLLAVVILGGAMTAAHAQPIGQGWLLGAETDDQRWTLLQQDLAGFSRAMWEVGYRYERMFEAIEDGHLELANHHWGGIESAIERGIVRRPGRAPNANSYMLDTLIDDVAGVLEGGDPEQARQAFMTVREACMECHEAERRPYLNDHRLFLLAF
jgi:hypothetical protein